MTDHKIPGYNQNAGSFAWAAYGKPLVLKVVLSRSQGLLHEATARGGKDAVSHRLRRAVENPCLGSKALRSPRAWADKRPADWSRVSHNPCSTTEAHCDYYGDVPSSMDNNSHRVGTFSINKWVLFRLSRFR